MASISEYFITTRETQLLKFLAVLFLTYAYKQLDPLTYSLEENTK